MSSYVEKNRGFITASKMKLFLKCPELYKKVYVDEVDTSYIKDVEALEKGRMVDLFILTPKDFFEEFAMPEGKMLKADYVKALKDKGIEVDPKDTVEKLKEKLYGGLKVVSGENTEMIRGISRELQRQPLWSWVPEGCKEIYTPQVELTMPWNSLVLKGTLDRFLIDHDNKTIIIRDLKTTSQMKYNEYSKSTTFLRSLATTDPFGYHLQLAMYKKLAEYNHPGYKVTHAIIDAVGTSDPYFYEGIELDLDTLDKSWKEIENILADIEKLHNQEYIPEIINRSELAGERYYKLKNDASLQKAFSKIEDALWTNNKSESENSFNWDDL